MGTSASQSAVAAQRAVWAELADQLRTQGYCWVDLDERQTRILNHAFVQSNRFFEGELSDKMRYAAERRNVGYRPPGSAFDVTADQPDMNDSIIHGWGGLRTIPHADEIFPFVNALEAHRRETAVVVRGILDALGDHYGYTGELPFERASFLQVNSIHPLDPETDKNRKLLQDPHEDGVLLTAIWTSAPGLERLEGEDGKGSVTPIEFPPNRMLIMPGGIMTAMTGGEIKPLYHQARNLNSGTQDGRKSFMYFVSPDVDNPVAPFVVNQTNRDVDVRRLTIENPMNYGMKADFVPHGEEIGLRDTADS